jgi:hypothetical protein
MKSFLSCTGKTRTLQGQLDMRVSTLILELVSDMTCYLIPFCIDNKQLDCFFFNLYFVGRAKQKGWSGIAWLCSHVLLKRKVGYLLYTCIFPLLDLNIFIILFLLPPFAVLFLFSVFLGKDWRRAPKNKNMIKSVRRSCQLP